MLKKILLISIFFAVLMFVPLAGVNATTTQVYVGVQVTAASAPGYNGATDNNWCLPSGTQMAVMVNTIGVCWHYDNGYSMDTWCNQSNCPNFCIAPVAPTLNPVTTTKPMCSGNTIWSGLLDLTVGTTYKAHISAPNFCPGVQYGYYLDACWVTFGADKGCSDTCANYGLTPIQSSSSCTNEYFSAGANCTVIEALKGSACTNCYQVSGSNYNYYNQSTGDCYYTDYGTAADCNAMGAGLVRACACNYPSGSAGFSFTFTP